MRCHYCDRGAAYAATANDIRVGLCSRHFNEQVALLSSSKTLERLRERLEPES